MDTVAQLKAEATEKGVSWRENDERLIWCGRNDDGSFTFRNTTSAVKSGPKITETEAAKFLAEGGRWIRPRAYSE